jgi:hypothetical protein
MRAYQVPIAILCVLSSIIATSTFATTATTVGLCTGTRPTRTDPPLAYAPEADNPQNCFAMATQVRGEKVCSDDAPGVVCFQHVVQLPIQIYFYTYSFTRHLCEETSRTYFGVDEADDCENPPATR